MAASTTTEPWLGVTNGQRAQGYLMIEQESHTLARRSYFVAERTRPREYARAISSGSPRRRPRPFSSTSATPRRGGGALRRAGRAAVLRLLRQGQHRLPDGRPAHDQRFALRGDHHRGRGEPFAHALEKVRVLNALFNERLTSPEEVLISADLFASTGDHLRADRSTSASRPWMRSTG